jgi:hypothetical protein
MINSLKKIFVPCAFILAFFCFISCNVVPVTPEPTIPTWAKYFSSYANYRAIQATKDGNMIVAGWNTVAKIDNNGTIIWQKEITLDGYRLLTSEQVEVSLKETNSGEFILAFIYEIINYQKSKLALVKLGASGELLWARSYEYPGDYSWLILSGIALDDNSGRIMIAGTNTIWPDSEEEQTEYVWLMQTDTNGNMTWRKKIQDLSVSSHNVLIKASAEGGCVITGSFHTNPEPEISGSIPCVMKFDAAGNLVWQKTYGASGGAGDLQYGYNYEYVQAIEQSPDGGYVVAGFANSVMKLNANGDCIWAEALSEVTSSSKLLNSKYDAWGESIKALPDGSIVIAGYSRRFLQYFLPAIYPLFHTIDYETHLYSPWLVKLDSSGKIVWQKTYEDDTKNREYSVDDYLILNLTRNSLQFYSLCTTSDNGLAISGMIRKPETDVASEGVTAIVLKVDSNGVIAETDLDVSDASSKIEEFGVIVNDTNCTVEDFTLETNPLSVIMADTSLSLIDM